METERKRVIRLFAEGKITASECAELLDAVGASDTKRAAVPAPCDRAPVSSQVLSRPDGQRHRARNGSSAWAVLLCIFLLLLLPAAALLLPVVALVAVPALVLGIVVLALRSLKWILYFALGTVILTIAALGLLPLVLLALPVVATVYWFCMLIGCLARDVNDFGVLISSDPALDKFLWILLVLLTWVVGALAYDLAVRHRTRPVVRQIA